MIYLRSVYDALIRFILISLLLFNSCSNAELLVKSWDPNEVQDLELRKSLSSYAFETLSQQYPSLTKTELNKFSVDGISYSENRQEWQIDLVYDRCETVRYWVRIAKQDDGRFIVLSSTPWKIDNVISIYNDSISRDEAISIGRLYLDVAIQNAKRIFPQRYQFVVNMYGADVLDPCQFLTICDFFCPQNGGGYTDKPNNWVIIFVLNVDETQDPDSSGNATWYTITLDAHTGERIDDATNRLFDLPKDSGIKW